jgi:hypothetical protein
MARISSASDEPEEPDEPEDRAFVIACEAALCARTGFAGAVVVADGAGGAASMGAGVGVGAGFTGQGASVGGVAGGVTWIGAAAGRIILADHLAFAGPTQIAPIAKPSTNVVAATRMRLRAICAFTGCVAAATSKPIGAIE